jgi:hypothetical protein
MPAAGPCVADPDGLPGERGIGNGLPHDGAAAGVKGTVDLKHVSPPLLGIADFHHLR